jgi:hypothetical protein
VRACLNPKPYTSYMRPRKDANVGCPHTQIIPTPKSFPGLPLGCRMSGVVYR